MDKIYSRKRIKIYKINPNSNRLNVRKKKLYSLSIILIIAFITLFTILNSISPIFEGLCVSKARNLAVDIINRKTREVLEKYQYNDIVEITHNNQEQTNLLKTDVATINKIISDISVEVTQELKNMEREEIKIYVGALTGNKYFSGMGPGIKIKLMQTGNITTDIKTEFESIGINQSIYRIYMDISCNINILTPYKTINHKTENTVLLVEAVIVGDVPETYYNLEGISKEDTMNMMN